MSKFNIDKRLQSAIFSGKDRLTKRLDKERSVLEKWAKKFVFPAIESAIAQRQTDVRVATQILPYNYGFDKINFMLTSAEKLEVVRRYIRTIEGLSVEDLTNNEFKIVWNLMLDDQLRPVPSSAV